MNEIQHSCRLILSVRCWCQPTYFLVPKGAKVIASLFKFVCLSFDAPFSSFVTSVSKPLGIQNSGQLKNTTVSACLSRFLGGSHFAFSPDMLGILSGIQKGA